MKTIRKLKVIFAAVAITIALLFLTRGGQSKPPELAIVEQKTIEQVVLASGLVKPENTISLKFPVSGKLISLNVEEGDKVSTGQAIASIDPEKYQIALRQVEQDVNLADAVLSQVYDEAKKYTAAENFDQKIRRTNAETAKNKAFDAMKLAQKNLRDTTILAPANGIVVNISKTVGEEIITSAEIAQLAKQDNKFVAQIDESDIGKIKIGQSAAITLDSLPDKTFDTQVTKIAPQATTTATSATVFEVTFSLPRATHLKTGASGEARIVIEKKENVLTIPPEALTDEKYVFVKIGQNFQKKEVEKGLETDTDLEIIAGLSKNDVVLASPSLQTNNRGLIRKFLP